MSVDEAKEPSCAPADAWSRAVSGMWQARLQGLAEEVRAAGPQHVRRMVRPLHVPLVAAIILAAGAPDAELAVDLGCGLTCVGDIAPSGWWESDCSPASLELGSLNHPQWHERLEGIISAHARRPENAAEVQALYEKTSAEVDAGLMHGPFTRDQLDTAFGAGAWRAMQRFAVYQRDKL